MHSPQELTNEQCEILDLPYGTKIVGEMDEFMSEFSDTPTAQGGLKQMCRTHTFAADETRLPFPTPPCPLSKHLFPVERLTKRGTYEGSAGLRYFGNEKFRKKVVNRFITIWYQLSPLIFSKAYKMEDISRP